MTSLADELREWFHDEFPQTKQRGGLLLSAADELDRLEAKLKDADILEQVLRGDLERTRARTQELEEEVNRLSSELIKAGLKGLLKTGKVGSR